MVRMFDLNIEVILENWTVSDALREIISNALDEQVITETKPINIEKDESDNWHIRDFGRGLQYNHFTQNENEEKMKHPNLIGKFGVGLKDALATFDRNNVEVEIISKYGNIKLTKIKKHDFEDIKTLHARVSDDKNHEFKGTDFVLSNIDDKDIQIAKSMFLKFTQSRVLDVTQYGEVIEKKSDKSYIYINGVKVAEEENFQFSYNITNIDKKIKRALNRERSNVSRSAYSYRVKSILLSSTANEIAHLIAENMKEFSSGNLFDEVKWIDVQIHAIKILNSKGRTLFLPNEEIIMHPELIDDAKMEGYNVVVVPGNLYERVSGITDFEGNKITNSEVFYDIYNESFEFKFIKKSELTKSERKIYDYIDDILKLFGGCPKNVKNIKISENMKKDYSSKSTVKGLWISNQNLIIIKRSELKTLRSFSGTILHELIHAKTETHDVSRDFENHLTNLIGVLCNEAIQNKKKKKFWKLF